MFQPNKIMGWTKVLVETTALSYQVRKYLNRIPCRRKIKIGWMIYHYMVNLSINYFANSYFLLILMVHLHRILKLRYLWTSQEREAFLNCEFELNYKLEIFCKWMNWLTAAMDKNNKPQSYHDSSQPKECCSTIF